ncbi:MAG: septation protein A [Rhodospirillaceae bacterium]|nr:septation protein A [Rhodospirillaceae bacterium]
MTEQAPAKPPVNQLLKFVLEMGPLLVFFLVNNRAGIFVGTGAFMAATAIALGASYVLMRTIPVMPLVTAFFVMIFGGLTIWLADDLFIKLKPTIINALFAAILLFGVLTGRLFIKLVLESAFNLTDRGWRLITWAWIGFFIFLAAINEIVWRNFSTDFWVSFKVFGVMPLTIAFSFAMIPIVLKHQLPEAAQVDENLADEKLADEKLADEKLDSP